VSTYFYAPTTETGNLGIHVYINGIIDNDHLAVFGRTKIGKTTTGVAAIGSTVIRLKSGDTIQMSVKVTVTVVHSFRMFDNNLMVTKL